MTTINIIITYFKRDVVIIYYHYVVSGVLPLVTIAVVLRTVVITSRHKTFSKIDFLRTLYILAVDSEWDQTTWSGAGRGFKDCI